VCVILSFSNNLYQRPSFPSQKHVTPLLSPLPVPAGRLCPYCTGFLRRVRAHNIAAEDSTAMRDRTEHANNPNSRHAGLVEIRTIPAKKDIAFVEFADEATATVAKDALHNFKIDGETKMKVSRCLGVRRARADIRLRMRGSSCGTISMQHVYFQCSFRPLDDALSSGCRSTGCSKSWTSR